MILRDKHDTVWLWGVKISSLVVSCDFAYFSATCSKISKLYDLEDNYTCSIKIPPDIMKSNVHSKGYNLMLKKI